MHKKWGELGNSGVGKNKRISEFMKEFLTADGDYSSPYFEKIRAFRTVMSGRVTKTNQTIEHSAQQHSTASDLLLHHHISTAKLTLLSDSFSLQSTGLSPWGSYIGPFQRLSKERAI